MTDDPRELDALIAERIFGARKPSAPLRLGEDEETAAGGSLWLWSELGEQWEPYPISRNAFCMLSLLDKLREKGWTVVMQGGRKEEWWVVTLYPGPGHLSFKESATTLPEAVARAAAKTVAEAKQ